MIMGEHDVHTLGRGKGCDGCDNRTAKAKPQHSFFLSDLTVDLVTPQILDLL